MIDPISSGIIIKAGASILPLAIDPVCKLINAPIEEVLGSGFASELGISIIREKLNQAAKYLKGKGKAIHTGRGQDLLLKIAGKSAMKDAFMAEHFQQLLVNAMDPECNLDIRNEDVDFLDSLNPADAVVIDVLMNYQHIIKAYSNEPEGDVQKVFLMVQHLFNANGDAMRHFKDNCISAQGIVKAFSLKNGLNPHLGLKAEHVQATFTERIQKKDGPNVNRPIIIAEGWHEYGDFEFPVSVGRSTKYTISQSRNENGNFVVGHLSHSAYRVGKIISEVAHNESLHRTVK